MVGSRVHSSLFMGPAVSIEAGLEFPLAVGDAFPTLCLPLFKGRI